MSATLPYRHLRKELAAPPEAPHWPDGVRVARFDPARDLADLHALFSATYAEAGERFGGLDQWRDWLTRDSEYDPAAIFLARDAEGVLVGGCHCWTSAFVKDLAVARAWRGRGIGRALLLCAFGYFHARGATGIELKVDRRNRTGAAHLYRALGMTEIDERVAQR